ncbi:MAG TPA: hypothetical protein VFJ14_10295 [Nocardioidaceae bacterium]|nr:hypothetical protein [Nocardioidaceae bacterium]
MDMATSPQDFIHTASDGDDLVAWAEPNTVVLDDPDCDAAVRRALSGPTPDDLAYGVPLLRFADTSVPAIPLVQAVIMDARIAPTACDRCQVARPVEVAAYDRLLVPCGASVVALHLCWTCKAHLDFAWSDAPSSLVWG